MPTPLAALVPLGGFRLLCPTTWALGVVVEVEVVAPAVPVVVVAGADAAGVVVECLEDPPPRTMTRTTTRATTTSAPTPSMIAPPRTELGRSERRGERRGERSRGRDSVAPSEARSPVAPGAVSGARAVDAAARAP